MNFCSRCGGPVESRVPAGDDRPRFVCPACGLVHYQNPKMVVGCVPEWEDRILLCRRAIEPRHGWWTIPAGYLENGETLLEGARRETLEEAGARVEDLELYTVFDLIQIHQIYLIFRGRLADTGFAPGPESLETRLFREEEIPWDTVAFSAIRETLRRYYQDRRSGRFPVHIGPVALWHG